LPPVGGNGLCVNFELFNDLYFLIFGLKLAGCVRLQVLLQMPVMQVLLQMTSFHVSPRLHFVQNYLEHVRLICWCGGDALTAVSSVTG
jgi:hypothetical protein